MAVVGTASAVVPRFKGEVGWSLGGSIVYLGKIRMVAEAMKEKLPHYSYRPVRGSSIFVTFQLQFLNNISIGILGRSRALALLAASMSKRSCFSPAMSSFFR